MSAPRRPWTAEADAILRAQYPDTVTAEIARTLRRPVRQVYARAQALGLRKSEAYLASPAACRLRRGGDIGKAYRFRPGQTPANKGLRRPGYAPGRMKDGQFKKGQLNGQAAKRFHPIGSTRLVSGYVYRKVAAVSGPWARNWRPEHWLVWEAAHGPVPPKHVIAFRDGNRQHCALENLVCVPRAAMADQNRMWTRYPKELASAMHLAGALKRQIRRKAEHGQKQDQ